MLFAENFEAGTIGGFDSETDTQNQLDIANYKTLARYPWVGSLPFSGAFCVRIVLAGQTADATLVESSIDLANAATGYVSFNVYFSPSFQATADDIFSLFEFQGAAAAITGSIGAQITAATGDIKLGIGSAASAAAPASFMTVPIQRDTWYTVELKFLCSTGGAGTADLYVTRAGDPPTLTPQVSLSSKTNIVVTDGVFGVQDQLATTTGVILLDNFGFDSARTYPSMRYANDPILAQTAHAFIGPGNIAAAALLSGINPTMDLYDTDSADTTAPHVLSLGFGTTNQSAWGGRLFFNKGCYAVLGGTTPTAQIMFIRSDDARPVFGPVCLDDANVRRFARSP